MLVAHNIALEFDAVDDYDFYAGQDLSAPEATQCHRTGCARRTEIIGGETMRRNRRIRQMKSSDRVHQVWQYRDPTTEVIRIGTSVILQ